MLTLWNPFDDFFDDAVNAYRRPTTRAYAPAVDVRENENAYVIEADLPGFEPSDVDVNIDGRVLTVTAQRRTESDENKKGYHRVERRYGVFRRSFTLPDTVDAEHIEASLENGVLALTVPKREAMRPRRIEVRGGGLVDKAKKVLGGDKKEEAA